MIYIFDTSSLSVLDSYYPATFQGFWKEFDKLVSGGNVLSCKEVLSELENASKSKPNIYQWSKKNRAIFLKPSDLETQFVAKIFTVSHFQQLISKKSQLTGTPVADPFVIALAKTKQGCVVTEEENKPNAARIPNVCGHFGIGCLNLEGFIIDQKWKF